VRAALPGGSLIFNQGGNMKVAAVTLALLITGCVSTVQVPDRLRPGAGESLVLIVPAKGVQIYECRAEKWVFVAPDAELFDTAGKKIGSHYLVENQAAARKSGAHAAAMRSTWR
jgi:hypothetical protein